MGQNEWMGMKGLMRNLSRLLNGPFKGSRYVMILLYNTGTLVHSENIKVYG